MEIWLSRLERSLHMREAVGSNPSISTTSEQAAYRLLRLFFKSQSVLIPLPSFSAKGHVRVACSLVNALTTAWAHYQPFAGTQDSCIFFVVPFQDKSTTYQVVLLFYRNRRLLYSFPRYPAMFSANFSPSVRSIGSSSTSACSGVSSFSLRQASLMVMPWVAASLAILLPVG